MDIMTVSMIAMGSAVLGFLTAALLSAAKQSDQVPTSEHPPETRVVSGPSQN